MKQFYLRLLMAAACLLITSNILAHDFVVDGIYYKILSAVDKTVEVTYKGASFSEYSNEYTGNVVIPETVTVSGTTVLKTYDAWTSTNKGSGGTTSQKSYTLNVAAGNILKFDWSVSSESKYDWLTITLDGTEIVKKSGTDSGSYEKTFTTTGTHTLVVKYSKDGSVNSGDDEGKIYNLVLSAADVGANEVVYSVTSIGDSVFHSCKSLTSITIPNSVTSIGNNAFEECTGLKDVYISDIAAWCGISFAGGYANPFYYASNLYLDSELVTELVIPYSITSIGNYAFLGCSGLKSVVIPNSVTSIGNNAFWKCSSLTSITIPNSVTSIGKIAFQDCTSLTGELVIPNSVTSIGNQAFCNCSGLTSVVIGNSVASIGEWAFDNCKGLESVTIPNSVTSIGNWAFNGCSGLTSIEIGNSVTSIGGYAFQYCFSLENMVVAVGNTVYDSRNNCNAIIETSTNTLAFGCKNTVIPNSVTSIRYAAFYGCKNLTSVVIPNSVTSIGNRAFYDCSGLTSITIPNNVTSIGSEAFRGCSGLTSITIPNNVTSIGNYTFYGCSGLTSITIPNNVTSIGERAFSACYGLTGELVIPNSMTSIGNYAFAGCSGLTGELVIPNSVTSIGECAFYNCSGLTSIVVDGNNAKYDSRDNCNAIIETETNTLLLGCKNTEIPNSVTSIGSEAFRGCKNLTSVVIPNSVTSIGGSAFYNCSGLKTVINFSNLTFVIGSSNNGCVAYYADKVYNAPNGSIEGDFIFGKSNDVNTLVGYSGNATELILPTDYKGENYVIGANVFKDNTTITSLEIPNSVTNIGEGAFSGCKGLTSIEIPNSVTSIENSAFNGCSGLTSITIPNNVTSIGEGAFYGCSGLTSIEIPYGVTSIGDTAFGACSNLRDITIPKSVTSLGTGTFGYCTSLESIELPNSVTTIPQKLFYGCSELTNVKIGNSVNEIDNSAFNGCKKLLMIIPKSVKYIGRDAFSGCAQAKLVILHKIQSIENTGIMPKSAHIYVPTETLKEHYAAYSDSVKYIFTEEVTPNATTLFLKITNNIPEIIESENIAIDNYDNVTDGLTLTGLEPDTEYTYYVTTEETGRIEKQVSARTESLKFKTLKAKATSNTRAVICAEANIANEETGTGFEWRRIDAPDLVPSEFAGCAVHEGVMEGALHNLRADTYYKYRPYYCSAAGNYYYGDWIGFGTADAYVYFTPTVHTYASAKRGVNSVCLNGYALAGSDDIREQGFEYWPVGTVQAAPSRNGDARNGASRVTASGQRMSIVIEDLEYGTVYACRAYVVTDSETFYGEEITFETSFPTGIADVYEKENEPSIQVQGNTIVVSGHKPGDRVLVYTMHGAVIYNGTADEEITLESGMYIVNIGNTTKKVRIR